MSENEKVEREAEVAERQKKADAENAALTGVGLRRKVGQTRGKGSLVIDWLAFDQGKPDTLPKSIQEFMTVTGVKEEPSLVEFLIDGFNDSQYSAASDPIGEFVNPAWADEVKTQFKLVVRNYSRATGSSIEDAVKLIKPGIESAQAKA